MKVMEIHPRTTFVRLTSRPLFVLVLLMPLVAPAGAKTSIEQISWLAGLWEGTEGKVASEELWMKPKGGLMLGLHRDVAGDGAFFEFLRIEESPDGLVFMAMPSGKPATPFPATEVTTNQVTFSNPDHDFPQQIRYSLEDEEILQVYIEGVEDGEARNRTWRWHRASQD